MFPIQFFYNLNKSYARFMDFLIFLWQDLSPIPMHFILQDIIKNLRFNDADKYIWSIKMKIFDKKVLMVRIWLRKPVLHLKANDVSLITRGLMPRMSCELYKYFIRMMMIWSFHFNSTNIFDNTQCLPTDNDHDKRVYIFPALYVNILEMPVCHCLEF